jgi:predicted PurR-regulated permease PerM
LNPDIERYCKTILRTGIILLLMLTLYFAAVYFVPMAFNVSGYFLKGLLPFVIAVVIAILIDPIVDWLEKKRGIGRGLAVSVVLLFFLFIIFSLYIINFF